MLVCHYGKKEKINNDPKERLAPFHQETFKKHFYGSVMTIETSCSLFWCLEELSILVNKQIPGEFLRQWDVCMCAATSKEGLDGDY